MGRRASIRHFSSLLAMHIYAHTEALYELIFPIIYW